MTKILITKPKVLNRAKQKELKEAGFIVIETNEPSQIKVIDEFGDLDRDTILCTALDALGYGNDFSCRLAFGNLMRERILKKRALNKTS